MYYLLPFIIVSTINLLAYFTKDSWFIAFSGDNGFFGLALIIAFYVARKFSIYLLKKYPPSDNTAGEDAEKAHSMCIMSQVAFLFIRCVHLVYFKRVQ